MSTLIEIEAAIEQLRSDEFEELSQWIEKRKRQVAGEAMKEWLKHAVGGATVKGITTDEIMRLTRGDE